MERLMFALTASVFSAVYLISIIAYGGHAARAIAIFAAFLACGSQYVGPDPKAWRLSRWLANAAFVVALAAYAAFVSGR